LTAEQPTVFFLPANQIVPWTVLVIFSYILTMGFFDFGFVAFGIVSFWVNGFGQWCAVGRKNGMSLILISQDLYAIIDIVFDTKLESGEADLPSRQQSQALEGHPDGSYAIDDEEATAIVREVIVDTVEATTLSQEAQTSLK
jgi:hypothetical protein